MSKLMESNCLKNIKQHLTVAQEVNYAPASFLQGELYCQDDFVQYNAHACNAAEFGEINAQLYLTKSYESRTYQAGNALVLTLEKAFFWYEKAASQGSLEAQQILVERFCQS